MAAAAIWKIEKLQYLHYGWTNFDRIWHGDMPQSSRPPQQIKFYSFKNSTWWPIAIWKYKKHDISKIICTYFSRISVWWCIMALPSLRAIKCTVFDNKTGNINDKKCSLSNVLTAMHQNYRNHKSDISQHHLDICMTVFLLFIYKWLCYGRGTARGTCQ